MNRLGSFAAALVASWLTLPHVDARAQPAATLPSAFAPGGSTLETLLAEHARDLVLLPVDRSPGQLRQWLAEPSGRTPARPRLFDVEPAGEDMGQLFTKLDGATGPVTVQAFTRQELTKPTERLQDALSSQAGRDSVLDLLRSKVWNRKGAFAGVETLSGTPFSTDSDGVFLGIAGASTNLTAAEQGAANLIMLKGRGVPLTEEHLLQLRKPASVSYVPPQGGGAFSTRYATLFNALVALVENPEDPENVSRFEELATLTQEAFVQSWPEILTRNDVRRAAVSIFDALEQFSEEKAVYGAPTKFEPASYETVYRRAERVVGIWHGAQRICSGLALSSEWVLTAGHCLRNRSLGALQVQFVAQAGVRRIPTESWPPEAPGSKSEHGIDFVFLRTAKATADDPAQTLDDGSIPKVCWTRSDAVFGDPVAVIGLEGQTYVYDGATVLYPHRVSAPEMAVVSAMSGVRITRAAVRYHPGDIAAQDRFFAREYGDFAAAYASETGDYTFKTTHGGQVAARPEFGFDTDTVHGNSGGPILSRTRGCLLGVFTGGQADGLRVAQANWRQHEYGTPLSQVYAALQALQLPAEDPRQNSLVSLRSILESLPE